MLYSGLTSITFRKLSVEEIIEIVKKAGLEAIEWGGDIHVPHGDLERARWVGEISRQAGIKVPSYGSYYRLACPNRETGSFSDVLKTAVVLGAETVRLWAGNKGSQEADPEWRKKVLEEARQLATLAEKEDVRIAFEYHEGTLTDTDQSAFDLLQEIDHSNIATYWQPPHFSGEEERCRGLKQILPWLVNIHAFYWTHEPERKRHPLAEASSNWQKYLQIAGQSGRDHYVMLEFVKGDSLEQFYKDAAVLKELITMCNS